MTQCWQTFLFLFKVIGACGGSQKCALVKQRGAIEAIDYNSENVKDRVKELTNGKGANVIIDAVGGDIFDQCVRWYVETTFDGKNNEIHSDIVLLHFAQFLPYISLLFARS